MAELPEVLAQGLRVECDVRGIGKVPGQIAWSAGGRIGITFDWEVNPLLARKPVGEGTQTPVYVKPIFARRIR